MILPMLYLRAGTGSLPARPGRHQEIPAASHELIGPRRAASPGQVEDLEDGQIGEHAGPDDPPVDDSEHLERVQPTVQVGGESRLAFAQSGTQLQRVPRVR